MGYNLSVWSASQNQSKFTGSKTPSVRSIKLESMFSKQKKNHDQLKQSNNVPPYEGFGNIFKDS